MGFVGVFWFYCFEFGWILVWVFFGFLVGCGGGCGGFEVRERERGACKERSLRGEKLTNGVNSVWDLVEFKDQLGQFWIILDLVGINSNIKSS